MYRTSQEVLTTMPLTAPDIRLRIYFQSLGWQGGTVHQVAQFTDWTVAMLLYGPEETFRWLASDLQDKRTRRTLEAR